MSRIRQAMLIIVMIAALLLIICVPLAHMQYQSRHIMNEVKLFPVNTQQTDNRGEVIQSYSIWERIGLVSQSVRVSSPLTSAFKSERIASQAIAEIIKTMGKQLQALQRYNALPELNYSEVLQASVTKETYISTDAHRSDLSLSVWAINAEYEDFRVYAYMDTKISALYDVTIKSKNAGLTYETVSGLENGFLEYLQAFSPLPDMDEREEAYSVNDAYTANEIVLHLYSVNTKTGKLTIYNFNDRNKFTDSTPNSSIMDSSKDKISGSESCTPVGDE